MKRNCRSFTWLGLAFVLLAATPSPLSAQTASWSNTGALNTASTRDTASALLNGKVLVAGGNVGGATLTATSELYDPATGSWSLSGNLNVARADHSAVRLLNGKVLVVGGIATPVFRSSVPSQSIQELFVNFPDPPGWVNSKQRLIDSTFLKQARAAGTGGEVLFVVQ